MKAVASISVAFLGILSLTGCTPSKPVAPKPDPKKAGEKSAIVRGMVRGDEWKVSWKTRNPKNPNGPAILRMAGVADSGEIKAADDQPSATLYNLNAKIYNEGKPSAHIEAPEINADRAHQQVVGTGGVTLVSLQKAAGTVVRADTLTWNFETGKMLAEGNASIERKAQGNQPDVLQRGNRIECDSTLDNCSVE